MMKQPGDAVNMSQFNFVEIPRPITISRRRNYIFLQLRGWRQSLDLHSGNPLGCTSLETQTPGDAFAKSDSFFRTFV
jgi:hypothetical protein